MSDEKAKKIWKNLTEPPHSCDNCRHGNVLIGYSDKRLYCVGCVKLDKWEWDHASK